MSRPHSYNPTPMPILIIRFWRKVTKTDTCWLWNASTDGHGYGLMGPCRFVKLIGERAAPRISWVLAYGPIPEGKQVLHRCDTPLCIRPEHLFLGTPFSNALDRELKGRTVNPPSRWG